MKRSLMLSAVGIVVASASSAASAHVDAGVVPGPMYVAPPPVMYAPPPVVYQAPPVVYAPGGYVYGYQNRAYGYRGDEWGHYRLDQDEGRRPGGQGHDSGEHDG